LAVLPPARSKSFSEAARPALAGRKLPELANAVEKEVRMPHNVKQWVDSLSAVCAVTAAVLWLISAKVKVWADGQTEPLPDRSIIIENGRLLNYTGTAREQSRWSSYAAFAAAAASGLQGLSAYLSIQ
jgi:hypothetical protein